MTVMTRAGVRACRASTPRVACSRRSDKAVLLTMQPGHTLRHGQPRRMGWTDPEMKKPHDSAQVKGQTSCTSVDSTPRQVPRVPQEANHDRNETDDQWPRAPDVAGPH